MKSPESLVENKTILAMNQSIITPKADLKFASFVIPNDENYSIILQNKDDNSFLSGKLSNIKAGEKHIKVQKALKA